MAGENGHDVMEGRKAVRAAPDWAVLLSRLRIDIQNKKIKNQKIGLRLPPDLRL